MSAYPPSESPGVRILLVTPDYFLLFFFIFVLFFPCQETILPKGNVCLFVSCIKKSSEASNYSFLMFAFELAISRRFVKDKPRRLS